MKVVKFQLLVVLVITLCIFCADESFAFVTKRPSSLTRRQDSPPPPPSSTSSSTTSSTSTSSSTTSSSSTPTTTSASTSSSSTSTSPSTGTPPKDVPDLSLPESVDGRCGANFSTICPPGFCCSPNNFCGVTVDHCFVSGCQPLYGTCGESKENKGFQFNTCAKNNVMAITFDDGPRNFTHTLLDNLKKRNVKATFFMNGHAELEHCIYDNADVLIRAIKEGHQIGHHTWSHPHLTQLSEEEVIYQIETLEVAFKKIIGKIPTILRPPFGDQNRKVQQIFRKKGYKMIIWDIDPNDFVGNLTNSKELYNSQMNAHPQPAPHMILNHDRIETTTSTLAPLEIDDAIKRGYKLTTVGDCIEIDEDEWYRDIGEPEERDDTWKCSPDDMHLPSGTPPLEGTPTADASSGTPTETPTVTPTDTTTS